METPEHIRIREHYTRIINWHSWGPYLSERQWGTVREDYSASGNAWEYFPHNMSRSRAYRWGEDGIAGICDQNCHVCFAVALWNGKDPILKERLFGLNGQEGNHGEDVKELYYYLDNTPTHSYMKYLYKYPQNEYPYTQLTEENRNRGKENPEFELLDTGIFNDNAYFDVYIEYAKAGPEDILIRITLTNRNHESADIHVLPTLWMRNFWSFIDIPFKLSIELNESEGQDSVLVYHPEYEGYHLYFDPPSRLLFTENETNFEKELGGANDHPFKKDLFHEALINNDFSLAEKNKKGTKFSPLYSLNLQGGESKEIKLRLVKKILKEPLSKEFDEVFNTRKKESDMFYDSFLEKSNQELYNIQKQALSGLLWSKQYYNYDVEVWLQGDPLQPTPPPERLNGRNKNWKTLRNRDIILMPDKWEYPWYATWDLAFHCIACSLVDAHFAKDQLLLLNKEWYMAPTGQIPAYEWSFNDVNPPVQSKAAITIYKKEKEKTGVGDIAFLKMMFNKLSLNFTWWVNMNDRENKNLFEGGFLGLDNIGVFDRSHGIPGNGRLEQVDATSWMALYCLDMLEIALEIALHDDTYQDMATKYFGHFVYIAEALNVRSKENEGIWDEEEDFFFDKLVLPDGKFLPIKIRSIVGLLSLTSVLNIKRETLNKLPKFRRSLEWFHQFRTEKLKYKVVQDYCAGEDVLLSLVPKERISRLFKSLFDETEFLSPHGIRSLSKIHKDPYTLKIGNEKHSIKYEPAESHTSLFGGNSNWRGPVWLPINYLFIDALKEYYTYTGDELKYEYPTGSGNLLTLKEISINLSNRLINLFRKDSNGDLPAHKLHAETYRKEYFKDLILFYEYFDGDSGRGVGASHQTGWTALVANLIDETCGKDN